jgi:hypothetical protein
MMCNENMISYITLVFFFVSLMYQIKHDNINVSIRS